MTDTAAQIKQRRNPPRPFLRLRHFFTAPRCREYDRHVVMLHDANGDKQLAAFRLRSKAVAFAVRTAFALRVTVKGRGAGRFKLARRIAYAARQRRVAARAVKQMKSNTRER